MRALIHIGAPKTGSTALQVSLTASREKLTELGFLYPPLFTDEEEVNLGRFKALNEHHNALRTLFVNDHRRNHFFSNIGLTNPQAREHWIGQRVSYLDKQLAQTQAHTCIFSGEHFIRVDDVKAFYRFFQERFDDLQVIAYIRPPHEEYESYVQQRLKSGIPLEKLSLPQNFFSVLSTVSKDTPHRKRTPDVMRQTLQTFGDLFGYENIRVVRFSRSHLIKNSIISDFAARFLYPDSQAGIAFPHIVANQSVSAAAAIFISILSSFPELQTPEGVLVRQNLAQSLLALSPSEILPKLTLSKDWKALISRVNFPTYQWIEEKFL
ncbi:MAG: hypothetical protein AAF984_10875, partial [Verrucomicrobiota bacterium]